ncbi:MAG: hypothetical protein H6718_26820 [Polyangiaceae bacterium]|nr:hypothetical protein [Polyangiaceae bacterium]
MSLPPRAHQFDSLQLELGLLPRRARNLFIPSVGLIPTRGGRKPQQAKPHPHLGLLELVMHQGALIHRALCVEFDTLLRRKTSNPACKVVCAVEIITQPAEYTLSNLPKPRAIPRGINQPCQIPFAPQVLQLPALASKPQPELSGYLIQWSGLGMEHNVEDVVASRRERA